MREIFIPKTRIPATQSKINEYRRLYDGKKNLYLSVYEYNGSKKEDIRPENAIIDKIFLDFDYDEDLKFFDDVKSVAKFLYETGIKFKIRFSGRGFHLFIYLDAHYDLKNPRQAIRAWVRDIHEKTNTTSDSSVVGDLRRVSRMIGTMNMKTHLYCIPLDYAHLMNFTYDAICEMAKENTLQCYDDDAGLFEEWIQGENLVDISDYDTEITAPKIEPINTNNIKIIEGHPPCIEQMLSNPLLGYYERGQLIIYLKDNGYSFYEILTILKAVLSEDKYYHCTEEENQPEYLYYSRDDLLFGNCDTQKQNGICPYDGYCGGPYLYL